MDNGSRENESKDERDSSVNPSKVIFFINNELVKVLHTNRANDICYLYNYHKDKEQTMRYSDFKKYRKRAFTVKNTLKIFKRSRMQLERWIAKGLIKPPTGAIAGGKRQWQIVSYYSEDDIFELRNMMASIHSGRPRKDGRTTPRKDIPTERDLRSLLGKGIMLYTKTEDGRFIPVWQEETW
ncbi:MAG: hypothetical protein ACO295_00435 [Sediminibacterium sp.]